MEKEVDVVPDTVKKPIEIAGVNVKKSFRGYYEVDFINSIVFIGDGGC